MRWILLGLLLVVGCGGKPPIEYTIKERYQDEKVLFLGCQISRQGTEQEYRELANRIRQEQNNAPGRELVLTLTTDYKPAGTTSGVVCKFDPNLSMKIIPGPAVE